MSGSKWKPTNVGSFAFQQYEFTNDIVVFKGYLNDKGWIHDDDHDLWYQDDPDIWKYRDANHKFKKKRKNRR